jgi:hypothetical protein
VKIFSPKTLTKIADLVFENGFGGMGFLFARLALPMKDSSGFFRLKGLPGKRQIRTLTALVFLKKYAVGFTLSEGSRPEPNGLKRKVDSAGEECRRAGITAGGVKKISLFGVAGKVESSRIASRADRL